MAKAIRCVRHFHNEIKLFGVGSSHFDMLHSSRYDEVGGSVTHVVDGDTFDLRVDHAGNNGSLDNRVTLDEVIRIRPADVNCPETRGINKCASGFALLHLPNPLGCHGRPQWSMWAWLSRTAEIFNAGYWLIDKSEGMRSGL